MVLFGPTRQSTDQLTLFGSAQRQPRPREAQLQRYPHLEAQNERGDDVIVLRLLAAASWLEYAKKQSALIENRLVIQSSLVLNLWLSLTNLR